jgi:hypothetical protein
MTSSDSACRGKTHGRESVDNRVRLMTLIGHPDHPQLANRQKLTSPNKAKQFADRIAGGSHVIEGQSMSSCVLMISRRPKFDLPRRWDAPVCALTNQRRFFALIEN